MRALHGLVLAQVARLVVCILGGLHPIHAQTFQQPGVLLSKAQLDYMKIMVNAHVEPVVISFCAYQLHSKLASFYGPDRAMAEAQRRQRGRMGVYRILHPAIGKVRVAEV